MPHWSLDDIPWNDFDKSKIAPGLASLIKAASVVEYNSRDYARYLCEVFADDVEFQQAARQWAEEEVQHGLALGKWAELADPAFDFGKSFERFSTGYKLPANTRQSVRGSRAGELVARCVVETGTSGYYTALGSYTDEPALKAICARIAADEFRHYKLFYTHLKRYLEKEKLGKWRRLAVALSRIAESEDDELAYAFHAVHGGDPAAYDHLACKRRHLKLAFAVYRREVIARMVGMMLKAAGLKPHGILHRLFARCAWNLMRFKRVMA